MQYENKHRGNSNPKLRVAVWAGLSEKKCLEKLKGLNDCEIVESGVLFRRHPLAGLKKFHQVCPPPVLRSSAALSHLFALLVSIPCCLRFKPDVCIGISLMPHSVMAKVTQVFCGVKFVTWLIGTDIYLHLAKKWWGKLFRKPMASASCTLTMGSGSNKMLESMGWHPAKLLVGRNAYDLSQYENIAREKQCDLIYTGRLDRQHKRLDILLGSVAELRKSYPSVKCAIVGEGPDKKRLQDICRYYSLEANVDFLGHLQDIPGLLGRSRILVMTSAWEGLPSSIVEAFVLGLPVVASNVGDISDIVQDRVNGVLVDSACPENYASAMLWLLENHEIYERISIAAKQTGEVIQKEAEAIEPIKTWLQAIKYTFDQ
jgi:glycosyltransferase involved in cell wall biosynthesis